MQKVGEPAVVEERVWSADERVEVRRGFGPIVAVFNRPRLNSDSIGDQLFADTIKHLAEAKKMPFKRLTMRRLDKAFMAAANLPPPHTKNR